MKQKDILRFWRNVEIFTLPDLNLNDVQHLRKEQTLPWNEFSSIPQDKKIVYTLFFGKVSKEFVIQQLECLFPNDDEPLWKEKVNGYSCFATLNLDQKGQPDENSYTIASYVLGMNMLNNNVDIASIEQLLNQSVPEEFLERYNDHKSTGPNDSNNKVIDWDYLDDEIRYLSQLTKWNKEDIEVYFTKKIIHKSAQIDTHFLNSFYLKDLNKIIDHKTILSSTLNALLSLDESTQRKDILKSKEYLFEAIQPTKLTEGKWPSKPEYGLCTAQLGAVNTIFEDLKNKPGIQGINGPPGTGKTTLLLDVIAQVIIDRSKTIIEVDVQNVFGKYKKVSQYLHTYSLHPKLRKNYGIVVASNNNAAVENISKELPQVVKIDKRGKHAAFPEADYFSTAAQNLTKEDNWGILAAALGNAKNKSNFQNNFWRSFNNTEVEKDDFYTYLGKEQDYQEQHLQNYRQAKDDFQTLVSEFDTFKQYAIDFYIKQKEYSESIISKKRLSSKLEDYQKQYYKIAEVLNELNYDKNNLEQERRSLNNILNSHNSNKPFPFIFQKLFKTKPFLIWLDASSQARASLHNIINKLSGINQKITNLDQNKKEFANRIESTKTELYRIAQVERDYHKLKRILCLKYEIKEENIVDENFKNRDLKEIHLLSPYHSEKVAILRSKLFLKALDVHKYMILSNAKKFKNNLNTFFAMISGKANVSEDLTITLWDTFFLCIPVVSTSLASASNLFPKMIVDQIGWLLIDEAGQATPQSAAGLIQRAKRCVIVGDPLQIEPVVTIPKSLVNQLLRYQDLAEHWSPYNTSVQQLADRISVYGTLMGEDNGIWAGFPLRTHRRCCNPMFDIANKIAYDDQMVLGTNMQENSDYIGASKWFDVTGSSSGSDQVINAEIRVLKEKVTELRENNYQDKIYIISPFKSIAITCSKIFKADDQTYCGTIHTFQGKEAKVVFIVLGSQPEKEGTRRWASSKPNMLNVALTRAKIRCYVIGNNKLWKKHPYFKNMSNMMPVERVVD